MTESECRIEPKLTHCAVFESLPWWKVLNAHLLQQNIVITFSLTSSATVLFPPKVLESWCVLAKLRGMCEPGGISTEMEHAVAVAQIMRCFVCDHHDRPINADECIQSVIRRSVREPYIVASVNKDFYTMIQELTGVPVLTFIKGNKTILPLKASHKMNLDLIKQRRLDQVEFDRRKKAEEDMEAKAVEKKEKAANKAFEKNKRSKKGINSECTR